MGKHSGRSAQEIRAALGHPVIDGDGHTIEFLPAFRDYLGIVGGLKLVRRFDRWVRSGGTAAWSGLTPQERHDRRAGRPVFWGLQTVNVRDRVTAMAPGLLRRRLDELGFDLALIYPTLGLFLLGDGNEELRRASARALNLMHAEIFGPHRDRLIPVAAIPSHTPEEAIDELDYAVSTLGYRAAYISLPRRPVPVVARQWREAAPYAQWLDPLALDSAHDYDPLWARFRALKVAVTAHSGSSGFGTRTAPTNHVYNHIGHFAAAHEAFAKALVLGGVTRRFPDLNFAFLEGGVGWAPTLYADLIGHWRKRNRRHLETYNPANLSVAEQTRLLRQFGPELVQGRERALAHYRRWVVERDEDPNGVDEFRALRIERAEQFRDLFAENFYFGCEADDPATAWAFHEQAHPFGARFKAFLGSDIGHWDVPDMTRVLPEAYELVERNLISERDFRDLTFANIVTLHGGMNRDFFKGTVVEAEARRALDAAALPLRQAG